MLCQNHYTRGTYVLLFGWWPTDFVLAGDCNGPSSLSLTRVAWPRCSCTPLWDAVRFVRFSSCRSLLLCKFCLTHMFSGRPIVFCGCLHGPNLRLPDNCPIFCTSLLFVMVALTSLDSRASGSWRHWLIPCLYLLTFVLVFWHLPLLLVPQQFYLSQLFHWT